MVEVAKMIKAHYNEIIQWYSSKINNSLLEGINRLSSS